MTDPSANLILYPSFAMFLLVAAVLARMATLRVGAIGSGEMRTYVALRYAHSYVHLTSNDVLRFRLYFGSGIVLAAMWTGLFAVLLTFA